MRASTSSGDKQNGLAQAKPRQAADMQIKQCNATKAVIDMHAKTNNWVWAPSVADFVTRSG
jgi:hypothetical protein